MFNLTNETPRKRLKLDNDPARQRVLFSGLDCLPGQQDLFGTDGDSEGAEACEKLREPTPYRETA